ARFPEDQRWQGLARGSAHYSPLRLGRGERLFQGRGTAHGKSASPAFFGKKRSEEQGRENLHRLSAQWFWRDHRIRVVAASPTRHGNIGSDYMGGSGNH